jgi:hypothetical protein
MGGQPARGRSLQPTARLPLRTASITMRTWSGAMGLNRFRAQNVVAAMDHARLARSFSSVAAQHSNQAP